MHDHTVNGGRRAFEAGASARELRLHLDNAHGERTSGLDHAHLAELHRKAHKGAEMEAAAGQVIDQLEAAGAFGLYLTDANGTVYLANEVDPRHMPAAGPLYRLTAQVPPAERVVDLLQSIHTSLAATAAVLARPYQESEGAHLSDRHGEADGPAAVAPHAAPSSTAAPSLLGTGSAGDAVDPMSSEGVRSGLPRPADRPIPSGVTSSGGAS